MIRRRWNVMSVAPEARERNVRRWGRYWSRRSAERACSEANRRMQPIWMSVIVHETQLDDFHERIRLVGPGAPHRAGRS